MTWRASIIVGLAVGLWAVGLPQDAAAHGAEEHAGTGPPRPGDAPPVATGSLAPGWTSLEFEPPEPGSYALPPLAIASDGRVLASDGSETTLFEVFGDRVVVLSFIYASCSDINGCPLATAVLQRLRARLAEAPDLAGRLQIVSLSFDPSRDTPDVMRRYGDKFARGPRADGAEGAHEANEPDHERVDWSFLTTGSLADLAPILAGYGQAVTEERDASGQPTARLAHLLRVYLIDGERRIRNSYTTSFLHPETLLADVRTLLLEAEAPRLVTAAAGVEQNASTLFASGDRRGGYERADYESDSVGLSARRGTAADLLARSRAPQLGLPAIPVPPGNLLSREKVQLGRRLFYDRRLSRNGTFSCALCHIPEQGFTNNEIATPVGIEGRNVRRNAPTIYNTAFLERLFHDGRETELEQQIWGPLLAANEMGNVTREALIERLRRLDDYSERFDEAFPKIGLTARSLGMALASYQRTLVSGASAFDRWRYGGESGALGAAAQRGFELFTGRGGCVACHTIGADSALLTDNRFHNTGVGVAPSQDRPEDTLRVQVAPGQYVSVDRKIVAAVSEPRPRDLGLEEVTGDPTDRWKYRTPSLRNVALTAPYMHDGSRSTLRDVVEFYSAGGAPNEGLDPLIRPLDLEPSEVADLVAFLEALTGDDVETLVADAFAAPIGEAGAERVLPASAAARRHE